MFGVCKFVEEERKATRFLSVETDGAVLAPLLIASEFVTDNIDVSLVSGAESTASGLKIINAANSVK